MMTEKEWLDIFNQLLTRLHGEYIDHHRKWREAEEMIHVNTAFRDKNFPKEIPDESLVIDGEGRVFKVLSTEEDKFFGRHCQCGVPKEFSHLYRGGWRSIYAITVINKEEFIRLRELILTEPVGPKSD